MIIFVLGFKCDQFVGQLESVILILSEDVADEKNLNHYQMDESDYPIDLFKKKKNDARLTPNGKHRSAGTLALTDRKHVIP